MMHKAKPRMGTPWTSAAILSDQPLRPRDVVLALLLSAPIVIPIWVLIWRHLP
jgi:hypothetical protein